MRVMTYNIRLGVESDLATVAAAISAAGVPDVLALQEIGVRWRMGEPVDQPRTLARALGLGFSAFAGALTDEAGGQFGVALVTRWPLESVQVTPLWRDRDEQRVLLTARMLGPEPTWLLNTHLSVAEDERRVQARAVGAAAAAVEGPRVLSGDLNARPGTPAVATARGDLTDCFDAAGDGPAVTFSVSNPHRRIDYICCGGGLVPAGPCRVARAATASDHFPLVAEVA